MVVPAFAAGEKLAASKVQQLAYEDSYTPSLVVESGTDPTLGTGAVQNGLLWLNGQWVNVVVDLAFGSSGAAAGSGNYQITLPSAYPIAATLAGLSTPDAGTGSFRLRDDTGDDATATGVLDVANNRIWLINNADGNYVTNAAPWVWAADDFLTGIFSYPTDFGS